MIWSMMFKKRHSNQRIKDKQIKALREVIALVRADKIEQSIDLLKSL